MAAQPGMGNVFSSSLGAVGSGMVGKCEMGTFIASKEREEKGITPVLRQPGICYVSRT